MKVAVVIGPRGGRGAADDEMEREVVAAAGSLPTELARLAVSRLVREELSCWDTLTPPRHETRNYLFRRSIKTITPITHCPGYRVTPIAHDSRGNNAMPPRQFIRPQEYKPGLGAQSLQASLSVEVSKKQAALDLGFDPEELRDPGIGDSGDSLEEEGDAQLSPAGAVKPSATADAAVPVVRGSLSGARNHPDMGAEAHSAAHPDHGPHDGSSKKLQNQLDLLKRVNAQLTKDKEHLQKQLQQTKHHAPHHAAHPVTSPKAGGDNGRVMQLLGEAEHFIAALRTSSCNYVSILKQERELYQKGAPTVVQQLQQELQDARRGASGAGGGDSAAAAAATSSSASSDPEFWKRKCEELQAKVQQQQGTIGKLQEDADNAEAEAVEAENDMNRKQAAIDQLAAQLEAQQAAMENIQRRLTVDTDAAAPPSMTSAQQTEVMSHLKKLKKGHAQLRAEAMAFCDMVSPEKWSMLVNHALQAAGSVQGRIEQAAVTQVMEDFTEKMEQMQLKLDAAEAS